MTGAKSQGKNPKRALSTPASHAGKVRKKGGKSADADAGDNDAPSQDAERRMEQVVRAQGRLTKKGGKMVMSGASEFQIAGGYELALATGL